MAGLNLGILLDVCEQDALRWMDPLETVVLFPSTILRT